MKKLVAVIAVFFTVQALFAQIITKKVPSFHLDGAREIKIGLPKSYKTDVDKIYPLILTLDGDYLFDPITGTVSYMSYWEDMPECIVVGIKQLETRTKDCQYDSNTDLPEYDGKKFYDFVSTELMDYLNKEFRLSKFKMVVGHDYTANFINYFMAGTPLFNAYINLSPEYAKTMDEKLSTEVSGLTQKVWYYVATADNDAKNLRSDILAMHVALSNVENENFKYYFDDFTDESHYSLVNHAIPSALNKIFAVYRPISKKEYKEVVLNLEGSAYDYLVEKYDVIESLIGIRELVRVNDFIAISTALEKQENWEELEKLGKLARKLYPEHMLGNYYLGTVYENTEKPKLAMKTYQNGYLLEEISFLTKDVMLEKAERIKEDFGW